jgi:dienelactone hydrolase
MARVLLLHSILGLRPAVLDTAERLRAAGHAPVTPDLFDGRVFDTIEAGAGLRAEIGIPELLRRASEAADGIAGPVVFAGYSMGGSVAQWLAATRPEARGALLFHHAAPLADLELEAWPRGVPVQVHRSEHDPYVEPADVAALGAAVREAGAAFDDFVYPGAAHLFADPDLPGYDAASSARCTERALEFLDRAG